MPSVGLQIRTEEHPSMISSLEHPSMMSGLELSTNHTSTRAVVAAKASHRVPINNNVVLKDHAEVLSIPSDQYDPAPHQ